MQEVFIKKWCAEIPVLRSKTPVPAIILELILWGGWRGNEDIFLIPQQITEIPCSVSKQRSLFNYSKSY